MLIDDVNELLYVDELVEADVNDELYDEVVTQRLELDEVELLKTDVVADTDIEIVHIVLLNDEMDDLVSVDTEVEDDELEDDGVEDDVADDETEL